MNLNKSRHRIRNLHEYAETDNRRIARKLINLGTYIEEEDHNGYTLLLIAAQRNIYEIVQLLIEVNVNPEAQTPKSKRTALHLTVEWNSKGSFYPSINAGARINSRDIQNNTPLHLAAKLGKIEFVDSLLGVGAKIDVKESTESLTPLQLAVVRDHQDIVNVPIENGVILNSVDK